MAHPCLKAQPLWKTEKSSAILSQTKTKGRIQSSCSHSNDHPLETAFIQVAQLLSSFSWNLHAGLVPPWAMWLPGPEGPTYTLSSIFPRWARERPSFPWVIIVSGVEWTRCILRITNCFPNFHTLQEGLLGDQSLLFPRLNWQIFSV